MSSITTTLHQLGCEGDVKEKEITRHKGERKKICLSKNKGNTESWGNLHNTFKFWLRVEELWQTAL